MILKHGSTIGNAKVTVDLLPKGSVSTQTKNSETSVTIHNTGVWDVPAENFNRSIHSVNKNPFGRQASWHFAVDDKELFQHIDTAHESWNTGVGDRGNETTISIEICMFKDASRQKKAEDNAIALVRHLMANNKKIGFDNIVTHQYWSGKYCPYVILSRPNGWNNFMQRVRAYGDVKPVAPKPVTASTVTHTVVKGDTLWGISVQYKVTVADIKNLNNLKSDVINVGDKLVVKGKAVAVAKPVAPKPVVKPVAKAKYTLPTGVLKKGSKGTKVTQLQTALVACNFYPDKNAKNNGVDGIYGNDTVNAVKRFQAVYTGDADGIYGAKTREALNKKLNK